MQTWIKIGLLVFIVGLGAFFYKDAGNPLPFHENLDTILIIAGLAPIFVVIFLKLLGLLTGGGRIFSRRNRCVRCGVKIPKGEMYCQFHKQDVQKEFLLNRDEMRERRNRIQGREPR